MDILIPIKTEVDIKLIFIRKFDFTSHKLSILISYSGNKGIKLHAGIFIKSLFKKTKQNKQTNKKQTNKQKQKNKSIFKVL